jgi:hypothetical protein
MRLVISALPGVNAKDKKNTGEAGSAVISGLMDVKPTDPVEGMLTSQMIVAHEAWLEDAGYGCNHDRASDFLMVFGSDSSEVFAQPSLQVRFAIMLEAFQIHLHWMDGAVSRYGLDRLRRDH